MTPKQMLCDKEFLSHLLPFYPPLRVESRSEANLAPVKLSNAQVIIKQFDIRNNRWVYFYFFFWQTACRKFLALAEFHGMADFIGCIIMMIIDIIHDFSNAYLDDSPASWP